MRYKFILPASASTKWNVKLYCIAIGVISKNEEYNPN